MSNENNQQPQRGRYEQGNDEALRNYEAAWKQVRKDEEEFAFQHRKRRILMAVGLILTTAAMVAFIRMDLIDSSLAMAFNAGLAAAFGCQMK